MGHHKPHETQQRRILNCASGMEQRHATAAALDIASVSC